MSTEIQFDEETRAALLLFNERVEETRARERATKRIAKAERAKTEAAAAVRNVGNDSSATAEQKAEAEAAYKEAVEEFTRISNDPHGDDKTTAKPADADSETEPAEVSADEPAEVSADEPAEVSADEEAEGQSAETSDESAEPDESE